VVLSVDGKGVPMRREHLRSATQKAAQAREHKLASKLSKGEKRGSKRMSTVAAVYARERPSRSWRTYAASCAWSLIRGLDQRGNACGRLWRNRRTKS
jgi:hypothetical protein